MKRLFLVLGLMFFCAGSALAECSYINCCPKEPYSVSSSGSRFLQKITGMNFISEKIAQAIIKSQLKKATKENFKVQMETYSARDLADGKFKSLKFSGKNLNFDGIYVTKLESKTLCDFNHVDVKKKDITFKENMVLDFSMEISSEDLKKTVASTGYLDMLNRINLSGYGITFFKITGADVQIKNNKLFFLVGVNSPFSSKPFSMELSSDVKISDGKIVLTQVEFANAFKLIDLNKMTYLINALNPLTFTTSVLNNQSKIKIDSVDIVNNIILIKGYVFIPKNTVEKG